MFEALRSIWPAQRADALQHTQTGADGACLPGLHVLEELVCAVHIAALQTATVASCVNALRAERRLENTLAMRNFVPVPPKALALLRQCNSEFGLKPSCIRNVKSFLADLAGARAQVDAYCADIEQYGQAMAGVLHMTLLTASWRKFARAALETIETLDPSVRRHLPERYHLNNVVLANLLRKVIAGGQPCIDEHGEVFLPELPLRRAAPRRKLCLDCVIEHQGRTSSADITDISMGGVRLDRIQGLVPQKVVLIELGNGRCLSGTVAWSKDHSAGIKFDSPLAPEDPLLAA